MDSNKTNSSGQEEGDKAKEEENEKEEILSPNNATLDNTKNRIF